MFTLPLLTQPYVPNPFLPGPNPFSSSSSIVLYNSICILPFSVSGLDFFLLHYYFLWISPLGVHGLIKSSILHQRWSFHFLYHIFLSCTHLSLLSSFELPLWLVFCTWFLMSYACPFCLSIPFTSVPSIPIQSFSFHSVIFPCLSFPPLLFNSLAFASSVPLLSFLYPFSYSPWALQIPSLPPSFSF